MCMSKLPNCQVSAMSLCTSKGSSYWSIDTIPNSWIPEVSLKRYWKVCKGCCMRMLGQPVSSFLPDFHPTFSDSFADIQLLSMTLFWDLRLLRVQGTLPLQQIYSDGPISETRGKSRTCRPHCIHLGSFRREDQRTSMSSISEPTMEPPILRTSHLSWSFSPFHRDPTSGDPY